MGDVIFSPLHFLYLPERWDGFSAFQPKAHTGTMRQEFEPIVEYMIIYNVTLSYTPLEAIGLQGTGGDVSRFKELHAE